MKQTLTTSQAAHLLLQDKNASWTYSGAYALIEYLEEMEEEGNESEFDIVAIRCDYSEYSNLQDFASVYFGGMDKAKQELDIEYDDEIDEKIREYIQDNGQLIEFDGGIIVSSF